MGINASILRAGEDFSNASFNPTAFSPAGNSMLQVVVRTALDVAATVPVPTVTASGLTFTKFIDVPDTINRERVCVFRAQCGATPGSVTLTINPNMGAATGSCAYMVSGVTGHDTTTPIVQSVTGTGPATDATLAINLAAGANVNNRAFAAFACVTTGTPGTNWTQLTQVGSFQCLHEWRPDAFDTAARCTRDPSGALAWAGAAWEVKASTAITDTDTASFSEQTPKVGPLESDTATFTETELVFELIRPVSDGDTATFTESELVTVLGQVIDGGDDPATFTEAESIAIREFHTESDTGSFSETELVAATVPDGDAASFSEAESVAITLFRSDPDFAYFTEGENTTAQVGTTDGVVFRESEEVHRFHAVFYPPTVEEGGTFGSSHPLWARIRLTAGVTVAFKDGQVFELQHAAQEELADYDMVFQGGRVYPVNDVEAAALAAAGYTITQEEF